MVGQGRRQEGPSIDHSGSGRVGRDPDCGLGRASLCGASNRGPIALAVLVVGRAAWLVAGL